MSEVKEYKLVFPPHIEEKVAAEGDSHDFEHNGMKCMMRRNAVRVWCGYVVLPKSHPLHGVPYDDDRFPDIEVHGGVTWAGYLFRDGEWQVGFDCCHWGDMMASINDDPSASGDYCTKEYVIHQCKLLANALLSALGEGEEG